MDKQKFIGVMYRNGDNQASLSEYLNMAIQTLNAKINQRNGSDFSLGQMQKIKKRYNLTSEEMEEIFFADNVS